jgi:hypothetical protein
MLADSYEDVLVFELKRHVQERGAYRNSGNLTEDREYFENKDAKIQELILKLDGTSHSFAGSARFRQLKIDYIV